jgi:hypothetical protein
VSRGQSNQEIADVLGIGVQTIKNYMTSIMGKLEAEDRTGAVLAAAARGEVKIAMPTIDVDRLGQAMADARWPIPTPDGGTREVGLHTAIGTGMDDRRLAAAVAIEYERLDGRADA